MTGSAVERKAPEIAFARPFYGPEEIDAAAEVIRSGWVSTGPRVEAFEQRFAATCGAKHGVATTSWTTGAFLVLKAMGVGPGCEVIVPSLTFIATVNVIRHVGATPVFADIVPGQWNVDPEDVARKVTPRTRAIMPVDQLGLPCDIDAIRDIADRHGLFLLDDAACAVGSRNRGRPVGSLAPCSVFSLHARKVVTTGEGGMILTDDAGFADRLRQLRNQGMSLPPHRRHAMAPTVFESYPEVGYNFRMTDLQAAIGLVQLDRLPEMLARRAAIAQRYSEVLRDHELLAPPEVPPWAEPNWQSYQIRMRPGFEHLRNALMAWLYERGVPTRRGVMASHREPPYRSLEARLPHTEHAADSCLQLPMHAGLAPEAQDHVLECLARVTLAELEQYAKRGERGG